MLQVDTTATLRRILDESSLPDAEKNRVLSRIRDTLGLPKTLDDVLEDILAAARMDSQFSAETARDMLEPVLSVKVEYVPAPLVTPAPWWKHGGPTCVDGGQAVAPGYPGQRLKHFVGTATGPEREAPF